VPAPAPAPAAVRVSAPSMVRARHPINLLPAGSESPSESESDDNREHGRLEAGAGACRNTDSRFRLSGDSGSSGCGSSIASDDDGQGGATAVGGGLCGAVPGSGAAFCAPALSRSGRGGYGGSLWHLPAAALQLPKQEAAEAMLFLGSLGAATVVLTWPLLVFLHATDLEPFHWPRREHLLTLLAVCAGDVAHNVLVALAAFVSSPAAISAGSLLIGPICFAIDRSAYGLYPTGARAAGYAALVVSYVAATFGDTFLSNGLTSLF